MRSIKYSEAEASKLDKLSLKLGRPKRQVFLQMVEYFYRTKKDPLDINDDLLKSTMLKQHKDYVGFIKTQENELLIPTKREVGRMIESQKKLINGFDLLAKQNEQVPALIERQNQYIGQLETSYRSIARLLGEREELKRMFLNMLDGYAAARDNISGISVRKEKEALLNATRNQVKML